MAPGPRLSFSSLFDAVRKVRKTRPRNSARRLAFASRGTQVPFRGPCRGKKVEFLRPFSWEGETKSEALGLSRRSEAIPQDLKMVREEWLKEEKDRDSKVDCLNGTETPRRELSLSRAKRNPFESSIDWTETSRLESLEQRSDSCSIFTFRKIEGSKNDIFSKTKIFLSDSFGGKSNSGSESPSLSASCPQSPVLTNSIRDKK